MKVQVIRVEISNPAKSVPTSKLITKVFNSYEGNSQYEGDSLLFVPL